MDVNFLHIFRKSFSQNNSGGLLLGEHENPTHDLEPVHHLKNHLDRSFNWFTNANASNNKRTRKNLEAICITLKRPKLNDQVFLSFLQFTESWIYRAVAGTKFLGGPGFTKAATTVSKEAPAWLAPTRQRKFWIFDLLDWLKTYLFSKISLGKKNQK